jgi:hypothetical protein
MASYGARPEEEAAAAAASGWGAGENVLRYRWQPAAPHPRPQPTTARMSTRRAAGIAAGAEHMPAAGRSRATAWRSAGWRRCAASPHAKRARAKSDWLRAYPLLTRTGDCAGRPARTRLDAHIAGDVAHDVIACGMPCTCGPYYLSGGSESLRVDQLSARLQVGPRLAAHFKFPRGASVSCQWLARRCR